MNDYTIEVYVPKQNNLQKVLQSAYDESVAGSFLLQDIDDKTKIVFDRSYYDDADMIENRLANGSSLQQAVSDQLADEFEAFSDKTLLSSVIKALRTQAVAYDQGGIPFSAYIGFFKSNGKYSVQSH